jgi:hypothetical protein
VAVALTKEQALKEMAAESKLDGWGRAPMPAPHERISKHRLLDRAKDATADRGLNYGKPEDNFARIAERWRAHLKNRFGLNVPLDATSVALMCLDLKLARLENDPSHLDSWVDAAGYAACGANIAAVEPVA